MRHAALIATLLLALIAATLPAQSPPLVDAVEWGPLRDHCRTLMEGLEALKAPLPPETTRR